MERSIAVRVLTRCTSIDQFVATFRRFSTDTAVFVPTSNQRDIGEEIAFSIRLVDSAVALAGQGAIAARHATPDNMFGKPGMLIDIYTLSSESQLVFERMRAGTATVEMPPLFEDAPGLADGSGVVAAPIDDDDNTAPVDAKREAAATTLGVAPLAPATFVSAPFVVDTPVPWPRASRPVIEMPPRPPTEQADPVAGHAATRAERTAMVALDRVSGEPQLGPWQAFCSRLASSVRGVRWWLTRRRSTQRIRSQRPSA